MFGFCVVGDEKQKRDIQIQFRSYRPNRRDESRYASKTDIIILHLSKKSKPLFDIFLKKSCFPFILSRKNSKKSSPFRAFFLIFHLEHASKNVRRRDFSAQKPDATPSNAIFFRDHLCRSKRARPLFKTSSTRHPDGKKAFRRVLSETKSDSAGNRTAGAPFMFGTPRPVSGLTHLSNAWIMSSMMLTDSLRYGSGSSSSLFFLDEDAPCRSVL